MTRRQCSREFGRDGRLDAPDGGVRLDGADRGTSARDHAAAADRRDDRGGRRLILEDFVGAGALAHDHIVVVERRDQHQPLLGDQLGGFGFALFPGGDNDLRSVTLDPSHLDGRRVFRHDDDRPGPEMLGNVRHGLAVVAARVGDDAASSDLGGEPGDGGVGAADLECTDRLVVFTLDPDRRSEPPTQLGGLHQRRPDRDAPESLGGPGEVVPGYDGYRHSAPRPRPRRLRLRPLLL